MEMDGLHLPDEIIGHIQSFLPLKYAIRSSVLSQSWLHSFSTTLEFRQIYIGSLSRFLELMAKRLERYTRLEHLRVEKLNIMISGSTSDDPYDLTTQSSSLVNQWLELAFQRGVRELLMSASNFRSRVPILILSSDRCLSLRVLILYWVDIDGSSMHELCSRCPFIEEMVLCGCEGFEEVQVDNFPRLREFSVIGCAGNKSVKMVAPKLQLFTSRVLSEEGEWVKSRVIDIDASLHLTFLFLDYLRIDSELIAKFFSHFSFLEHMTLDHCELSSTVDVISDSLITLTLEECDQKKHASFNIVAPKLLTVEYIGYYLPNFCFTGSTQVIQRRPQQGDIRRWGR